MMICLVTLLQVRAESRRELNAQIRAIIKSIFMHVLKICL